MNLFRRSSFFNRRESQRKSEHATGTPSGEMVFAGLREELKSFRMTTNIGARVVMQKRIMDEMEGDVPPCRNETVIREQLTEAQTNKWQHNKRRQKEQKHAQDFSAWGDGCSSELFPEHEDDSYAFYLSHAINLHSDMAYDSTKGNASLNGMVETERPAHRIPQTRNISNATDKDDFLFRSQKEERQEEAENKDCDDLLVPFPETGRLGIVAANEA
eukprot:CAMPEP_0116833728 /NCGR_PEP_ID=MMETSP0418-20121206/6599_1 /TAXON_ID=1158023 /ORGANISM="Astrosyne radiata, Strain 13vi08-1A" /LENGTH=215 /DNA_ID=CAMNT_0004463213 /DNA_START=275 /DNA_END=922 /DNA_ORIENTATION=+